MALCEYCRCVITPDMKVCESCGAPIPEDAFAEESSYSQCTAYSDGADYRLILVSCGSCARSQAEDLLEDLLSYDTGESRDILDSLPAEAARNLTREQASYLAQALTEYGMEVSVCDSSGYVDLGSMEGGSVFDSSGNYIRRFAEILAMLTAANRVIRPIRWGQPIDRRHIFMPDCPPPHPPVHRRRKRSLLDRLFGTPEPPRRKPAPVPPVRRNPEPAPRREPGRGSRSPMNGMGAMPGGSPSMGRNGGMGGSMGRNSGPGNSMGGRSQSRGGSSSMGRSGGPGGSMGGRSQSRGGSSSMGRSGGPGGSMGGRSQNRGGSSPMGRNGGPGGGRSGGSRGPSRGHGAR